MSSVKVPGLGTLTAPKKAKRRPAQKKLPDYTLAEWRKEYGVDAQAFAKDVAEARDIIHRQGPSRLSDPEAGARKAIHRYYDGNRVVGLGSRGELRCIGEYLNLVIAAAKK